MLRNKRYSFNMKYILCMPSLSPFFLVGDSLDKCSRKPVQGNLFLSFVAHFADFRKELFSSDEYLKSITEGKLLSRGYI